MDFNLISTAYAMGGAATEGGKAPAPMWPMLIAIFVIFYFFMIRPQQKRQKEQQQMLQQLEKGQKIVTIGGIIGTIVNIKPGKVQPDAKDPKKQQQSEDILVIKTADDAKIEMIRSSIGRVLNKEEGE